MSQQTAATIHLGTCAWAFDDWRGVFYPDHMPSGERLAFYARWFNAVEADSTFYHAPPPAVAAHWAEVTPPGFRFTCKVPREITHEHRLRDAGAALAAFLRGIEPLGEKLGCLLVQLPPGFHLRRDETALREFIHALPDGFRWAVEFRDQEWHLPRIAHLLEHRRVAWVWNDMSPYAQADAAAFAFFPSTADFAVVRLMGDPATKYRGDGSPAHHYRGPMWPRSKSLDHWAVKIRQAASEMRDVFVAANNHFEGFAPFTAREIAHRLGLELSLPEDEELHPRRDRDQMRLWAE